MMTTMMMMMMMMMIMMMMIMIAQNLKSSKYTIYAVPDANYKPV